MKAAVVRILVANQANVSTRSKSDLHPFRKELQRASFVFDFRIARLPSMKMNRSWSSGSKPTMLGASDQTLSLETGTEIPSAFWSSLRVSPHPKPLLVPQR